MRAVTLTVCAIGVVVAVLSRAAAQCACNTQGTCTATVFYDDFSGSSLSSAWSCVSGTCSVSGGVLSITNQQHYGPDAVVDLGVAYGKYTVRSRQKMSYGGGAHCWRWRSQSEFFCNFYWNQDRSYVSYNGAEGSEVPSVSYSYGTWYDAYSFVDGASVTLQLGTNAFWSKELSSYYGGLTDTTHVGLSVHQGTDMVFDDFEVTREALPVIRRDGRSVPPLFATVGAPFSYTLDAGLFDARDSTGITYSATLEDGSPLPGWLSLHPTTGTLSGVPTGESLGGLSLTVTASGTDFGCATAPVIMSVYGNDCSFLDAEADGANTRLMVDFVDGSPNAAGLNLLVVAPVEDDRYVAGAADAFPMPDGAADLAAFVAAVPDGHMVLVATGPSATHPLPAAAADALTAVGVTPYATAQAMVAIGRKGAIPGTVPQRTAFVGAAVDVRSLVACHVSQRTTPENTAVGTRVGNVVRTNAPDLTFPLGGMAAAEDAAGAHAFFSTHPRTGVLSVAAPISFEAHPVLVVQVLVREGGWRSVPATLAAQAGAGSYLQVAHGLDTFPTRVKVLVESADFAEPNFGYWFEGIGAAQRTGHHPTDTYGGVVYGWDDEHVRMWAPSGNAGTGSVIEVNTGWGDPDDDSLEQHSDTGLVHVWAWLDAAPQFDSGWFTVSSQAGAASFHEVAHGLGDYPWRVKVYVRPTSGSSSGFVFPASGSDIADDDNVHGMLYGGVVFAYNDNNVRLWAPTVNNNQATGRVVSVSSGWADGHMATREQSAEVKVLAWTGTDPDFDSGWFDMSTNLLRFKEVDHNLGAVPERVKVFVKPADGVNAGYWFEASGAQLTNGDSHTDMGAITFAYSDTSVRLWAPNTAKCAACVGVAGVTDGWGDNNIQPVAAVRVVAWKVYHGLTDAATITVTVTDEEEAPVMPAATLTIDEKPTAGEAVADLGAVDDDGDELTFDIVSGDPDGAWSVSANGELVPVNSRAIDYWAQPTWVLAVRATDPTGLSTTVDVTVHLRDLNDPPELPATVAMTVREGAANNDPVGDALGATDLDQGQSLAYTLVSGNVGDAFKVSACSGQLSVLDAAAIDFETAPQYTLVVRVVDDGTPPLAADTTVTVTVENLNDVPTLPPVAVDVSEATPVGTPVGPALAPLVSDEDAGDAHTFRITAGGSHTTMDAATGQLTLSAPLDHETQPRIDLVVEVTDDGSPPQSSTTTVALTVTDANDAPVWTQAVAVAVPENSVAGTTFGAPLAGKVADEDAGDAHAFTITAGDTEPPSFAVDAASGQLSVLRPDALDHEAAATLVLQVTATDDGSPPAATPTTVAITVTDVNEAPVLAPQAVAINENVAAGTAVAPPLAATDPDGNPLAWAIVDGAPDPAGVWLLDAASGGLTLAPGAALDHEATPTYTLTVAVTDDDGMQPLTTAATVTITVADVNEPPALAADVVLPVDEDAGGGGGADVAALTAFLTDPDAGDTATWTLTDGGPRFTLASDTGVLALAPDAAGGGGINHEAADSHTVVVRVADAAGLTALQSFRVAVGDVNDAPAVTVADHDFAVPENSADDVVFGTPLAAFTSDEDRPAQPLTFAIAAGDADGRFDIDPVTGQLGVAAGAGLDAETTPAFTLTVTVSDTAGGAAAFTVAVEVVDANDPPQDFTAFPPVDVAELTAPGTPVGTPVAATDPDDGQTVSYSIVSGDAGGQWVLGAASGQLAVAPGAVLDYEATPVFTLTLAATDDAPRPLFTTTTVVVRLTDVPEAPTVAPAAWTLPENAAGGTPVGALVADDPDADQADTLTYSLAPAAAVSGFAVDAATGAVTVAADIAAGALDFEAAGGPVHTLTATVADVTGRTATAAVTVTLTDVAEAPVVAPPAATLLSMPEGAPGGTPASPASLAAFVADADAADAAPGALAYAVTGGTGADVFDVHAVTGDVTLAAGAELDFEAVSAFDLQFTVTDGAGLTAAGTATAQVADVNDLAFTGLTIVDFAGTPQGVHLRTNGRDYVEIAGANFGPVSGDPAPDLAVTYGPTGVEYTAVDCATTPGDNTVITCRCAPGVGTDHTWRITVNGNTITSGAVRTSYEPPSVQHGHYDDHISTQGGTTVLVHLDNGGFAGMPVDATYGPTGGEYTAVDCFMADDFVNVNCTTVEGSGGGLRWVVTVAGQTSAVGPPMTAYSEPEVHEVHIAAPDGDAEHDDPFAHNHGDHAHRRRVLSSDGGHTAAEAMDPHFNHTHRLATVGGQRVLLRGVNFGPPPAAAYLEGLDVEDGQGGGWIWTGAGQVTGKPASARRRLDAGHGGGGDNDDEPPPPPAGGGGGGVVPHGGGRLSHYTGLLVTYGPTGGEFLARDCVMTVAHTELECRTTASVGAHHAWVVRANLRTGDPSAVHTHCFRPSVEEVTGPGAVLASTKGGQQVTLTGANFGRAAYHPFIIAAWYSQAPGSGDEKQAQSCAVTGDHTRITCVTVPGVGTGYSWRVSVAGQLSDWAHVGTGYAPPTVSHFTTPAATPLEPHGTPGADVVVVHGHNFGADVTTLDYVWYGPTALDGSLDAARAFAAVDCVMHTPHEAVRCVTAPGAGTSLGWVVAVGGQPSVTASTQYAAPSVTGVALVGGAGTGAPTAGGARFTVTGANLATPGFLDAVTYGPGGVPKYVATDCVHVVDHAALECGMVPGVGADLQVQVVVGGQASEAAPAHALSYLPPTVATLDVATGPTAGGATLTITGDNWGVEDTAAVRYVTFADAVVPHAAVATLAPGVYATSFTLPEGVGTGHEVAVGVAPSATLGAPRVPAAAVVTFDYDPPVVALMHTSEAPAVDGVPAVLLVIKGANFGSGAVGQRGVVLVDGAPVPEDRVLLYAHDRVEVVLLMTAFAGELRGEVVVQVGGQASEPRPFQHLSPQIISAVVGDGSDAEVERNAFASTGGGTLTLLGTYFGELSQLAVTVGGRPCADLELITRPLPEASTITCTVPPGEGRQRPVVVSRGGQLSEGAPLNYLAATVASVAPAGRNADGILAPDAVAAVPTAGGVVTVTGDNWGTTVPLALLGGEALAVTRVSHTQFRVAVPPGTGAARPMPVGTTWPSALAPNTVHAGPCSAVCASGAVCLNASATCADLLPVPLLLSYGAPVVADVRAEAAPGGSPAAGSTTGGFPLVISGANFGGAAAAAAGDVAVQVCPPGAAPGEPACRPCPLTAVTHASVTCTAPPGQGGGLTVVVAVDGQSSWGNPDDPSAGAGAAFAYAPPHVAAVSLAAAPSAGGMNITITGANFGVEDAALVAAAAAAGGGSEPVDEAALPASHPLLAHRRVVLHGWDAGDAGDRVAAVLARSDGVLSVVVPAGMGPRNLLWVEVGGQASNGVPFAYAPPVVTDVLTDASCCNTDGGYAVTVVGTSLGFAAHQRVWLSKHTARALALAPDGQPAAWRECVTEPAPLLSSHTHIRCVVPPGIGADLSLVVVTGAGAPAVGCAATLPGGQALGGVCGPAVPPAVSNAVPFSYDPPQLTIMNPAPANAQGGVIKFLGTNFGARVLDETAAVNVTIHGEQCGTPEFIRPALGTAFLTCVSAAMPVGPKNLTLNVAAQEQRIYADVGLNVAAGNLLAFTAYCEKGLYGRDGEACLDCPRGAVCEACAVPPFNVTTTDGGTTAMCGTAEHNDPVALPGWWQNLLATTTPAGAAEGRCHANHLARDYCPQFVPCEPKEACQGNNTCSAAYVGDRCRDCADRYYRLSGVCEPCPDNAYLIIVFFVVVAISAVLLGYFLSSKKLNFAVFSVGVDYFQVLALFSRANVQWPPILERIFQLLGIFNLNLDLTAPECSIPNLSYVTKWTFIMLLPFAAWTLCGIIFVSVWFKKKFILRRDRKLTSHGPTLLGMSAIIAYYLYLVLTRSTLDIFNCSPTDPPDGHEYLEVVFERCGEPGGVHVTLLPYAIVSLVFFCIGFPVWLLVLLLRNKRVIWEDQLLRCHGLGDQRRTSTQEAYMMRKKWSRLYYHFTPERYFWKVVILGRKGGIAFVSLMFRRNVAYQLGILLLLLICAYALQLKFLPYMSPADMKTVLTRHDKRAKEGNSFRATINANLAKTLAQAKRDRIRANNSSWLRSDNRRVQHAADFFLSYNTIEATLLFCAMLVALGGILFESGQLDASDYRFQRDLLSVLLVVVIFASILYYLLIVAIEIRITLAARKPRTALERKKSALTAAALSGNTGQVNPLRNRRQSATVTAGLSPMFRDSAAEGAAALANATPVGQQMAKSDVEVLRAGYKALQEENAALKQRLAEAEATRSRASQLGSYRTRNRPGAGSVRAKKTFRPQTAAATPLASNPLMQLHRSSSRPGAGADTGVGASSPGHDDDDAASVNV